MEGPTLAKCSLKELAIIISVVELDLDLEKIVTKLNLVPLESQ